MSWFGYAPHREGDGLMSFVHSPFAPEARWPRFHLSIYPRDGGLQVNIHLDQEDARGQGNHQFIWAYRNPLVMEECWRLEALITKARESILKQPPLFNPPVKIKPRRVATNSPSYKIIAFLSKQKILCRFF
jgi:hypothetical protein